MTGERKHGAGHLLRRWSERKHASARQAAAPKALTPPSVDSAPSPAPAASRAVAPPVALRGGAVAPSGDAAAPPVELPPVESLTLQSDFTAFMRPDVDPTLRRAALRKLFNDPRFNVMDGLDVYIDDYSKPDPISPDVVRQLVAARNIFFPPQTRVNAQGIVEDVPLEPQPAAEAVAGAIDDASVPTPSSKAAASPRSDAAEPAEATAPKAACEAQIELPPGRPLASR